MENLSKEGKALYKLIQDELSNFKTEIMEQLGTRTTEIQELKADVKVLKQEVEKLKSYIDDSDCYERRDTIIFSGNKIPASNVGENCTEIVRQIVKNELKIEISPTDISTSHRLGRKPSAQGQDRRNIVVKLCRRDLKRDLITASKKQGRTTGLFINESLTPTRQKLLYALRQIKRSHPDKINGCTSIEGRIYAYTKSPNPSSSNRDMRHLITSSESLQKFCDEYIKLPLENFLQNYTS